MNLAAALQAAGAILLVVAAATVTITLAVLVAGLLLVAFGVWEELSS